MKSLFLVFIGLLFISNNAAADQCVYIDEKTRDAAYEMLKTTDVYTDFCAPCQDAEPIEKKVDKLEYKKVDYMENDEQFYKIYINDKPIDLAYVYINGRNLGMQTSCKTYGGGVQRVPEYIDDYLNGKWILPKEREPEWPASI